MADKYILYIDDTGSRDPDKSSYTSIASRSDNMDCFGLGGILVKEEDIDVILQEYNRFCAQWHIDYPLHSSSIRGGRGKFAWLKKPENAGLFLPDLQEFLLGLPFIGGKAGGFERDHAQMRAKHSPKPASLMACSNCWSVPSVTARPSSSSISRFPLIAPVMMHRPSGCAWSNQMCICSSVGWVRW